MLLAVTAVSKYLFDFCFCQLCSHSPNERIVNAPLFFVNLVPFRAFIIVMFDNIFFD